MAWGTAIQLAGMYEQNQQAKYDAKVAEAAGQAESDSIQADARRLAGDQRKQKASQRVAMAQGGQGDQPLMVLADEAKQMNMDQLEMQRQAGIAREYGNQASLLARMQGRAQMLSSGAQAANSGYNAYQSWKSGRGTTGSSTNNSQIGFTSGGGGGTTFNLNSGDWQA